jgi:hypothetical protein
MKDKDVGAMTGHFTETGDVAQVMRNFALPCSEVCQRLFEARNDFVHWTIPEI